MKAGGRVPAVAAAAPPQRDITVEEALAEANAVAAKQEEAAAQRRARAVQAPEAAAIVSRGVDCCPAFAALRFCLLLLSVDPCPLEQAVLRLSTPRRAWRD